MNFKCFAVLAAVVGCAMCIPLESTPAPGGPLTTLKPGNLTSDKLTPAEDSAKKPVRREATTTVAPKINATTTLLPEKHRRDAEKKLEDSKLPLNVTTPIPEKKTRREAEEHKLPMNVTTPIPKKDEKKTRREAEKKPEEHKLPGNMTTTAAPKKERREAEKKAEDHKLPANMTTTAAPKKERREAEKKAEDHKLPANMTTTAAPKKERRDADDEDDDDEDKKAEEVHKLPTTMSSTMPPKKDEKMSRRDAEKKAEDKIPLANSTAKPDEHKKPVRDLAGEDCAEHDKKKDHNISERATDKKEELKPEHPLSNSTDAAKKVEDAKRVMRSLVEHHVQRRSPGYGKKVAVVRESSYSAPAVVRESSYSAPAVIRESSYSEPAVVVRDSGYSAPAVVRESSYSAPAVVVRDSGYSAPAVVRESSYEEPAVVVAAVRSSRYRRATDMKEKEGDKKKPPMMM